jgi:hypothetical protein
MKVPSINFAYGEFLNFTAEAQSPQREVIFYLPLRGRQLKGLKPCGQKSNQV